MSQTYIGDGVYASFDGFALTLWTDREENGFATGLCWSRENFRRYKTFWSASIK